MKDAVVDRFSDEKPETENEINTRLKRALSRADNQFALFFALVNFPNAIASITTKLKQNIDRPIIEITVNAEELKQTTLDAWLLEKLKNAPEESVIFLYNFAELLPPQEKELRKNLQQINWRRASLAAIHRPLVIWLPHYAIDSLAEHAPDFYDWYSNVYDYATDSEIHKYTEQTHQAEYSGIVDPAERLSQKEKQKWVQTLKSLLHENPQKNSHRATLENQLGMLYQSISELNPAHNHYKKALTIQQKIGDKSGEGATLNNISQIFKVRGDYEMALSYLMRSLEIQQKIRDKSGEGTTLNNISQIFKTRGDYETALSYLMRSLEIQQKIGNKSGESTTLNNISGIYNARGDYETALSYLMRSLEIQQKIGDKSGEGATLNNISQIYNAQGGYETALSYLIRSLEIEQGIGDKSGEGTTLNNMATIAHARGDYETALSYLMRSLEIQQEIGDKSGEGTTLNNISSIYNARGNYETALSYLMRSLEIRQEIGDKSGEGATLNNISQIFNARGDYETALSYLMRSLEIQQEIGYKSGICATLFNIGHIYYSPQNNKEKGLKTWGQVYALAKPMKLVQALDALEDLAEQLGFPNGLESWEEFVPKA